MKPIVLLCVALLATPIVPSAVAAEEPTCTPVGPCVPAQRMYEDIVGSNAEAIGGANVGWLNLQPGNIRFQPLLDLAPNLAGSSVDFAGRLLAIAEGGALAVADEAAQDAVGGSTWVLGLAGEGADRATASALAIAGAGDAVVVVTVSESGAWVSFVNAAGITLASGAVSTAHAAPSAAAAPQRAVAGGLPYAERKALEAVERLVEYLADPPTDAAQRDVDENGLGDTWEDTVCRSRFGAPGLPPDACEAVDGVYHMARAYATADFDGDHLSLLDEYRWNSDPLDPDTDKDGIPDGPESDLWRRSESDVALHANLWTCPADARFDGAKTCSWRHPDSFRDDDGDGRYNMGQDPDGVLAFLGVGDADSENDALTDGDEYYGCHTDPAYGPNDRSDPDVPGFAVCGGATTRGHGSDPLEPDTDGDGLTDRQEVCSASGGDCARLASYATDPLDPDTDEDGWNDGPEAAFWSTHGGWFNDIDSDGRPNNLNDPDSDRDGIQDGIESMSGLRPDLWDTDGDGMPDQWEQRHGLEPRDGSDGGVMDGYWCATPGADLDGDGLCNVFEYAFQRPSHWNEARDGEWVSVLQPLRADMDGDGLDDGYEVFPARTPGYFDRSAQQHPDTPGTWLGYHAYRWDHAYGGYAGSTRVDLADTDGDGLSDAHEHHETHPTFQTHTNPNHRDSDGDGLDDPLEVDSDPADWDTDDDDLRDSEEERDCVNVRDCDGDGLPDNEEGECDPRNPDSDGDRLTDREERDHNSFCRNRDSDGDGLEDGDEVHVYGTFPSVADSDGDGLTDREEVTGSANAGHTARDATAGVYRFDVDRCQSVACTSPGATDPRNWDTDGDGLSDGQEVDTERYLVHCPGGCWVTATNPNRADTDGDGYGDKHELDFTCYDGSTNVRLNPSDFDIDGDLLPDGRERDHLASPCDPDTDNDRLPDGAEVELGTLPNRWSSDTDSISDLHDLEPLADNEAPLVLGLLRPWGGSYNEGACIRVADGDRVHVERVQVFSPEFQTDRGIRPLDWWDAPWATQEYDPDLHPNGWRWEGHGDDEALCVRWWALEDVRKFNVTFADPSGNLVSVQANIKHNLELDFIQLSLTAVCFFTGGSGKVAAQVADKTVKTFSVAYSAADGDAFGAVKGAVELATNDGRATFVNGKAIGSVVKVLASPVGCVVDLARGSFVRSSGEEVENLSIRSSDDKTLLHAYRLPWTAREDVAFFAVPGKAEHTEVTGGGTAKTYVRGTGYDYLFNKYPAQGNLPDRWRGLIQEVIDQGTHATADARPGTSFDVYTRVMDGQTWSVYVHGMWIYDVEIA